MPNWSIHNNPKGPHPRSILHIDKHISYDMDPMVYDYRIHIPIVLSPMGKYATFVLSEFREDDNRLGLKIHDLRIVDNELTSSIMFQLRSDQFHLGKFKSEMNRACDDDRCVAMPFFFRKLNYTGFNSIYRPKTLQPKQNSTLRAALNITSHGMKEMEKADEEKT